LQASAHEVWSESIAPKRSVGALYQSESESAEELRKIHDLETQNDSS